MFENYKVFKTEFAGREISFETGMMCGLSNGSCLVRYGETAVLCNVTMSRKPREGVDFFPLSVDYEEKLYSVGKIPGSFIKREGRPSDKAILTSRLVDRPIRPLFPKDMRNDVAVVMTVMSADADYLPEVCGLCGASLALSISDIPWNGPVAGCNVGLVDGRVVLNPDEAERRVSDLDLTVVASADKIVMIEAGANEVDEAVMLKAIETAHAELKNMVSFIAGIQKEIGKQKAAFESKEPPRSLCSEISAFAGDRLGDALLSDDKLVRDANLAPVAEDIHARFDAAFPEAGVVDECINYVQKDIVRGWLRNGRRVDGRGLDDIRQLDAKVSLIPRVHGSGMFSRGQTQVLTIATLGPVSDAQMLDGIDGEESKRYMHQYNFPSYSVGETRPSRGPGRREIGHGALAERALLPVIPPVAEFPYALRLVSEVLSSNGSTSQGSICASTLALMDAGVPIKAPVAGISCGLITDGDGGWMTMVDIQGLEDFFGDMDFKVGGTRKGITAIQVDIKVDGLTMDIIREAFEKTRKARLHILDDVMAPVISEPRAELSKYAPKMLSMKIDVDKIRDVIGTGGKVIQKICAECDVKVDVEEDGSIFVSAIDIENARRAINVINTIVNDPEVGALYKGRVTRLMNFGAFVEIAPGKEGLCHISKLENHRVEKVEDVVNVGDEVVVMVTEIDAQGRVNLSRRDALAKLAEKKRAL